MIIYPDTPLDQLPDALLFERIKALLKELRAAQADLSRRLTEQSGAVAKCGHAAHDATGLYCAESSCDCYTPF